MAEGSSKQTKETHTPRRRMNSNCFLQQSRALSVNLVHLLPFLIDQGGVAKTKVIVRFESKLLKSTIDEGGLGNTAPRGKEFLEERFFGGFIIRLTHEGGGG